VRKTKHRNQVSIKCIPGGHKLDLNLVGKDQLLQVHSLSFQASDVDIYFFNLEISNLQSESFDTPAYHPNHY
jgi:hypothetical protein